MRRMREEEQDRTGRAINSGGPSGLHAPGGEDDRASAIDGLPRPLGPLKLDWKLFEHHLADSDLSEEEKREFLEALWYIICTFVDLGFGIEPVQQAMKLAASSPPPPDRSGAETGQDSKLKNAFGKGGNKQEGDAPGRNTE